MRQFVVPTCLMLAIAQPVAAEDLCVGGPRDKWLNEDRITELVSEMGYNINDFMLMIEDGCLEAKLIHDGNQIEIYFEPITGEVVKIKIN